MQFLHADCPERSAYVPPWQGVSSDELSGQKLPAVHSEQLVCPGSGWNEPSAQGAQERLSVLVEYDPVEHGVHSALALMALPAGQTSRSESVCVTIPVTLLL